MTDRKRLIELFLAPTKIPDNLFDGKDIFHKVAETYADTIISDGWIRPPCKVGDTVYAYCETFCVVLPYTVTNFHSSYMGKDNENYLYWEGACFYDEKDELIDDIEFDLDDIGKTAFLTPEEAEKALAERQGEEP